MKTAKGLSSIANDSPQARQIIDESKITTNRCYKKINTKKHFFCLCCTCTDIGHDIIRLQYTNFNDILIEDDSKLIFQPFGREIVN